MPPITKLHIRNENASPPAARSPPKRVLVVDDLPEICQIFVEAVRRIRTVDVRLETETDSQRAVETLKREPYDLVVSDFRMPRADGADVLVTARTHNPDGRRILVTGYNEISAPIEKLRRAAIDAYVQKPLRGQDLVLLLMTFLEEDETGLEEFRRQARAIEVPPLRDTQ